MTSSNGNGHDNAPNLGGTPAGMAGRDCVHIAIAPCVAGEALKPGDHVGVMPDGSVHRGLPPVGVVDPFRLTGVAKGERCWVCLYPGSIRSLRHVWTHPAFKPRPPAVALTPPMEAEHVGA